MDWAKLANAETAGVGGAVHRVLESLGKKARTNFYDRDAAGKATKNIEHLLWEAPARVLAAPVRAVEHLGGGLLHGPKLISGPMAGRRMHPIRGPGEFTSVSKEMYDAWKKGEVKGDFVRVPSGWGRHHHFQRNYERGGLVGAIKKHPYRAGAVGLGAALLVARPGLRPLATGMLPEVPENGVSPDVQSTFSQEVGGANPLTKSTWG